MRVGRICRGLEGLGEAVKNMRELGHMERSFGDMEELGESLRDYLRAIGNN